MMEPTLLDQIRQPCECCASVRRALRDVERQVREARHNGVSKQMKGDYLSTIHCSPCENRGWKLTPLGEELLGFLAVLLDPEKKPEEIPF